MKEKDKPLVKVAYICMMPDCNDTKYKFELYYESKGKITSYCSSCKCITNHRRVLPSDDNEKHYRRPSLFV